MQPILSLIAPVPGMVLLSGRFAGELRPGEPLILPLRPFGAQYLTFLPLEGDSLPLSRRLIFSAGRLLPGNLSADLCAVAWPGGVTEVEFTPPRLPGAPRRQVRVEGGVRYALVEAAEPWLELETGGLRVPLPEGAHLPELQRREGCLLFSGASVAGEYLAAASADGERLLHLLAGTHITLSGDLVRVVAAQNDIVGHARLETWRLSPEGLTLESAEPAWADSAPHWPVTAEETALALVQAALLGLDGEAETWLAPQLAGSGVLRTLLTDVSACVPLKYALQDGRPAVALLRAETANFARAEPLYYRAIPAATVQGSWQIAALER